MLFTARWVETSNATGQDARAGVCTLSGRIFAAATTASKRCPI